MREKIAGKVYTAIYNNPSQCSLKETSRRLADQILSLPVDGFGCTLGELPEKARKMKRALQFYSSTIAVIIKRSHPTNTKDNPYEETRIDTPYPNIADDALSPSRTNHDKNYRPNQTRHR